MKFGRENKSYLFCDFFKAQLENLKKLAIFFKFQSIPILAIGNNRCQELKNTAISHIPPPPARQCLFEGPFTLRIIAGTFNIAWGRTGEGSDQNSVI